MWEEERKEIMVDFIRDLIIKIKKISGWVLTEQNGAALFELGKLTNKLQNMIDEDDNEL